MRILISGAGIAGPTLAYWLLKHDHEPVIVEHAPVFRSGGYMIDFWGPGYEVADRMGLLRRLRALGYKIDWVKFVDRNGALASSLDVSVIYRSLGDRYFSLPRGDLAQTIFDTVSDKIEVMFGDSVTSLKDDEDGVEVTFKNSANRRFDIVVGCDGLHSEVRRVRFGPEEQFEKYLGYYVASFITDSYPHRDTKNYLSFSAPGSEVSRYALRGDRTAFLFVFTQEKKFPDHFSDESAKMILSARFRDAGWNEMPQILARLEAATDIYFDAVSQIRMPCWSKGRVALVGDAAHCPSLLAGEGASFAMAGAYILANEFSRAPENYTQAFQNYESSFRDYIAKKQKSAQAFAGSFAPRTRFGIFIRNQVLKLSRIPFVAEWLMQKFVTDDFELPVYGESQEILA